jgi:hypothetical protein
MRYQIDGALSISQRAICRFRSMIPADMDGDKEVT